METANVNFGQTSRPHTDGINNSDYKKFMKTNKKLIYREIVSLTSRQNHDQLILEMYGYLT